MRDFIESIAKINTELRLSTPNIELVDTLSDCSKGLDSNSELLEFFEEIASQIGDNLTLSKNGFEIRKLDLSPINDEVVVRVEPGLYQLFFEGRLIWEKQLTETDCLVDYASYTKLAASDKQRKSISSHESFMPDIGVALIIVPGLEYGSLNLSFGSGES